MVPAAKISHPKVAVLGAKGFLGRALARLARQRDVQAACLSRAEGFDLSRPDSVDCEALAASGHRAACIAGAVTGVAACEADPEGTARINVRGVLDLAARLAGVGILPVWFSSDYVFDGRRGGYADDATINPVNEYGRQKAEVEARMPESTAAAGGHCLILRLSRLYSTTPGDGSLLSGLAARLLAGGEVRVAHDQVFSPTHVDDAARTVMDLVRAVLDGSEPTAPVCSRPLNLAAPDAASRLDVANAIVRKFDLDPGLVRAISLDDLGEPFQRPKDTSLISARLAAWSAKMAEAAEDSDPANLGAPVSDRRFRPLAASVLELASGFGR